MRVLAWHAGGCSSTFAAALSPPLNDSRTHGLGRGIWLTVRLVGWTVARCRTGELGRAPGWKLGPGRQRGREWVSSWSEP
eukprot:14378058-Alexandrium_andersonii.AAC.1